LAKRAKPDQISLAGRRTQVVGSDIRPSEKEASGSSAQGVNFVLIVSKLVLIWVPTPCSNDRNGDAGCDQSVLDSGSARLISKKVPENGLQFSLLFRLRHPTGNIIN